MKGIVGHQELDGAQAEVGVVKLVEYANAHLLGAFTSVKARHKRNQVHHFSDEERDRARRIEIAGASDNYRILAALVRIEL